MLQPVPQEIRIVFNLISLVKIRVKVYPRIRSQVDDHLMLCNYVKITTIKGVLRTF